MLPKLYRDLASWWPLISRPADYWEEAATIRDLLREACDAPPVEVLELGCGGGNNASHLKSEFRLTLVDCSPSMLEVSRALNPECKHVVGDMRDVRLGRLFDAVFIHDAISYMATSEDLRRAIETAFIHCRPGGAALFVPDFVRNTFRPEVKHGGHDRGRLGVRYIEWTYDPDPSDTSYVCDFAFMLRGEDGWVRTESDRHVCGLFDEEIWLGLLGEAGFRSERCGDPFGRYLFRGTRSD